MLGKHWRLRFKRMKDHGLCHHPDKPFKEIQVNSKLRDEIQLEVILHELLHSCGHDLLSEEWVTEAAQDLAKVLWRIGYRRSETNGSSKN